MTLNQALKEIKDELSSFGDEILREISLDTHTRMKKRIFSDGIKSDGTKIGDYSFTTEKIKRKKGRFTSNSVNLRDTETLVNSFLVLRDTLGDYEIGFVSGNSNGKSNTDKIILIENKYGEVFIMTDDEENHINNFVII